MKENWDGKKWNHKQILILFIYICPMQAIVAAFGFDEQTVATGQGQAGRRAGKFTRLVQQGRNDTGDRCVARMTGMCYTESCMEQGRVIAGLG
jgi:hypothetical protein